MLWNRRTQLGYVFESSASFTLPDGSVRSPDASWVAKAAYDALPEQQRLRFPPVCPAFVVEVRAPSDGLGPLRRKMETYLANGVQVGFLLDPTTETATVYRPSQQPEELTGLDRTLGAAPPCPASSWICARYADCCKPFKNKEQDPSAPPFATLAYPVPGRRRYRYFGRFQKPVETAGCVGLRGTDFHHTQAASFLLI